MIQMKRKNNKVTMMKKGYVFIILFTLFIAISRKFMYRYFIKRDFSEKMYLYKIIAQGLHFFFIFFIPGLLLVRWYYKIKDNKSDFQKYTQGKVFSKLCLGPCPHEPYSYRRQQVEKYLFLIL